ncbi:unnamed protein product, partial [Prorocentrum cordatum]
RAVCRLSLARPGAVRDVAPRPGCLPRPGEGPPRCGMGCSGSGGPALDAEEELTPVPSRFWVRLHRGADDLVGVSLGDAASGAVLVCVKEGGIVDKWSRSNPSRAIRPGYIIEEINGVRGYWNLLDVLRNEGPLVFKVATVPPASAGPDWFEEIAATAK